MLPPGGPSAGRREGSAAAVTSRRERKTLFRMTEFLLRTCLLLSNLVLFSVITRQHFESRGG